MGGTDEGKKANPSFRLPRLQEILFLPDLRLPGAQSPLIRSHVLV